MTTRSDTPERCAEQLDKVYGRRVSRAMRVQKYMGRAVG